MRASRPAPSDAADHPPHVHVTTDQSSNQGSRATGLWTFPELQTPCRFSKFFLSSCTLAHGHAGHAYTCVNGFLSTSRSRAQPLPWPCAEPYGLVVASNASTASDICSFYWVVRLRPEAQLLAACMGRRCSRGSRAASCQANATSVI